MRSNRLDEDFTCIQVQGSGSCCRDDPALIFPIKIGTYPILLSNTAITQQPTVSGRVNYGTHPQQNTIQPTPNSVPSPSAPTTDADSIGTLIFFGCKAIYRNKILQILPHMRKQFLVIQMVSMEQLSNHPIQFFDEHLLILQYRAFKCLHLFASG